jgi:hypothetical protein
MTRTQLLALCRIVAMRKENYGRPPEWVEANVRSDAMIPVYVHNAEGPNLHRCVVVPQLNTGYRARFSIDLQHHEITQFPTLTQGEANSLLRELLEYVSPAPLTPEQRSTWGDTWDK